MTSVAVQTFVIEAIKNTVYGVTGGPPGNRVRPAARTVRSSPASTPTTAPGTPCATTS
jgi:hypothetical protein